MKKIVFLIAIALLITTFRLQAQSWWGGFGKANFGYYHLTTPHLLPGAVSLGNNASNLGFGGAGFGRIGERMLIGGGGNGVLSQQMNLSDNALQVKTDFGMGFFDLGWVLAQKKRNFIYTFAGVGGGGINLSYVNNGTTDFRLAENIAIRPQEVVRVRSGGFAWEAGISLNRLLYNPETQGGGFNIGVDLGVAMLPRMSNWALESGNKTTLNGLESPSATIFYVRLVVGGGAF